MPSLDWDTLSQLAVAAGGALTGLGWTKILDYLSEKKRIRESTRLEEEKREDQERATYQSRLHDDYMYLREELRKEENLHRECERDRLRMEGELFRLREQVQILQFKYDVLEEEVTSLRK